MTVTLLHGDALEVLRTLPDCSVDAIVTDPPAGISFMGKQWDTDYGGRGNWIAAFAEIARECLRVVKPGAHALVWAIPRTSHWTATAWENGGWEVRDRVAHVFGSGFPKSHDVSKAIDKAAGAERETLGTHRPETRIAYGANAGALRCSICGNSRNGTSCKCELPAPATDEAKRWQGWGSALKPAMEDWWLLRKPLTGTIAANVMQWGTGAINVGACRVEGNYETRNRNTTGGASMFGLGAGGGAFVPAAGRWPSHLIHDGSDEVVAMFPQSSGGAWPANGAQFGYMGGERKQRGERTEMNDTGSAARFFYVAKSSKRDRDEGLPKGMRNTHPTVKSVALCRYLCRLITPAGGVVLDPFMGSGSTGKGAVLEGFSFIGIEREADYIEIARARIAWAEQQVRQLSLEVKP